MFGTNERCQILYNGKVRDVRVEIIHQDDITCWSFTDNGYRTFKIAKLKKIST